MTTSAKNENVATSAKNENMATSAKKRKMETLETEGGNTRAPSERAVPSKYWCFTYNNYPEDAVETLETCFKGFKDDLQLGYIFGKEIGDGTQGVPEGTPHLQGYIFTGGSKYKNKIRPIEKFRLSNKIHWEKRKHGHMHCINYCAKDGDYFHSADAKPAKPLRLITPDRPWQREVVRLAEQEPDDRTIHWFWEAQGGVGKTSLCKWLVVRMGAIILGGKASDIRNGVIDYYNKNKCTPELIVVNITRSQEQWVSYEGLENVKDMLFYSGKYEGGMVCGPPPQLMIFANFAPKMEAVSADRWHVMDISELM
jgi:hypothetical protein